MSDIVREELEKLGIYQLRIYARQVGVKLATTLKKADLIDSIMNVLNGNQEPYVKPTKKGRPAKEFIAQIGVQQSQGCSMSSPSDYGLNTLFNPDFAFDKMDRSKQFKTSGVLDVFANGSGVIVPRDGKRLYAFVGAKMISEYKLKKGDLIEGNVCEINGETILVLADIDKINGFNSLDTPERLENFEKISKSANLEFKGDSKLVKIFDLMDLKIKQGDKVLIASEDRKMVIVSIFNFIDIISNVKDTKVVVLGVSITDDFVSMCNQYKNVKCIGAMLGDDVVTQLKMLDLGIQHVKNLVEYKDQNVLCVLLNVDNVIQMCDADLKEKWVTNLEKLFLMAGNTNAGSLTVAYGATINDNDKLYRDLELGVNVYLKACELVDSRRLLVKFNWLASYSNELIGYSVNSVDTYGYMLSMFLSSGKTATRQQQIEQWAIADLDKQMIKSKIEEYIKNETNKGV